ncbi:hypothetical protein MVEN_01189800 [Mycena venus]|uniref:Uncharacterized protein n=1 Tax=Mycena venus TaxID=2733690 RepID=A0A8H6Y4W3_9AGAR|nr:hypothetical protein MVEN_01189800 [Mycena venus]
MIMSVVDPSDYIPQLVVYSTFNIFAACSLVALVAVTLLVQDATANLTLLNLEVIFIISSSTSSALIWTGHARDSHPPFTLCLFNASATMSNTPLMAGAALALVAKVWGTAMIIWHPRYRQLFEWVTWTPFLLSFPYISAIPLFIAGIVSGLQHRNQVFRGSPFYCVVNLDAPQSTSSILGAIFTFISLVLAAWTSVKLIRTRQRTERQRFTSDPGSISFMFAIRVILFSFFVGAAFVSGIVALTSAFDAVVPDIIVASCGVGAFFIFASARPILHFVFCRRDSRKTLIPSTTGLSWGSGPITPQEFTLSSMTVTHAGNTPLESGKQPPTFHSHSFGGGQIQITRVVETHDEGGKSYWSTM